MLNLALLLLFLPQGNQAELEPVMDLTYAFCDGLNENNDVPFTQAFSTDLFLERLELYSDDKAYIAKLKKELRPEIASMINAMKQSLAGKMNLEPIRFYKDSQGLRAIVRMIAPDGAFNYFDFLFKKEAGKYKIADLFVYINGCFLSQTLFETNAIFQKDKGIMDKLLKLTLGDQEKKLYSQFLQYVIDQKYQEAVNLYPKFSSDLQKERVVLMNYFSAAQNVDEKTYVEAMNAFKKHRPNDSNLNMILIDYYLTQNKQEEAVKCIDRLNKTVGGDPFLTFHKGKLYFMGNQLEKALAMFQQAIKEDETYADGYDGAATVYIAMGKFQDVVDTYKKLEKVYDMKFKAEDFQNDPVYETFVQSEAYKKWFE